jgi:hypothetical protein
LNPEYPRVYAPVLRSPLLFHHTGPSYPIYKPAQPRAAQTTTNFYSPHPTSFYRPQSRNVVQAPLPYRTQPYPYYSAVPKAIVPPVPLFSYAIPSETYTSTVSSKGLSLILIATLILVALDLVIVRPQKR